MGRIYAGILGWVALVTLLARGLIHQSATGSVMLYATAAMFAVAAVGWIAGTIAETTIAESVRRQFDDEVAANAEASSQN